MPLMEIDRRPSAQTLRTFGWLLGLFLLFVAAGIWRRTGSVPFAAGFGIAAIAVPALYFAIPALRWPLYIGWVTAAYPFGWTVSQTLLIVIFYGIVTPCGFLMRLTRYDPMHRKRNPKATSHWRPLQASKDLSRYFRQS